MPSKDGWTLEREHDKITLGKKQYRNMEEWSRPCAVCAEKFFIYVRAGAQSVNSSFGLRTCKDHRGQRTGAVGSVANDEELAAVKKELDEAYEANLELMQQAGGVRKAIHETLGLSLLGDAIRYDTVKAAIESLKAKYELQAAVEATAKKLPWG